MPRKEVKLPNNVSNNTFLVTLYLQNCLVNDLEKKNHVPLSHLRPGEMKQYCHPSLHIGPTAYQILLR